MNVPYLNHEQVRELVLAVAMFVLVSTYIAIPDWIVGVGALIFPLYQGWLAHDAEGWAVHELLLGLWFLIIALMTVITPAWGIPFLYLTSAVLLVGALGDVGMAIVMFLLALLAYSRNAPDWAVGVLVLIGLGELFFVYRRHRHRTGSDRHTPT